MNSSTKIANERKQDKQRIHRSLNLAYIYLKNNELAEAEKYAREYVAQETTDRGHKLLGDILRAQNKRDEALTAYEKSLQLNPQQEDVLSLVCDLITPDITNCDRLALWASRAAKSGFLDVADKFRRSQDAAKSASFPSDSKLNRLLKNIASSEKGTPKQKEVNGNDSPANQSRLSLDSVDFSFSGMRTKALPSPVLQNLQNRPQDGLLKNLSVHQESILKSLDSQNGKISDSNTTLLKAIGENKLMIHNFKKTLDTVLKELREVKLSVKQVEERQKETSATQKKLLDAFQTFQTINEDYGDEEYENGEYEDYGEGYEQGGVPFGQPLQPQTPLNVKTLPNFTHLQISPEKKPASDLVQKAESLQLPSTFFNYLDNEDCPGCRGCESEQTETGNPVIASPPKQTLAPAKLQTAPLDSVSSCAPSVRPSSSGSGLFAQGTKPFGFQPPVSNDAPSLMFGGNKLSEVSEKKSETSSSSFSFKVPDGSGFFSDGKAADFTWGNDSNQAAWMKSGPAPIFGQKPAATIGKNNDENDGDDDGDDGEEEYDPQYAPIIEMPNLVEVTTGEEEEEVVYSQRAKLFRYDKPSKQWKERGVGDLKILKHRSKPRFRIVLRREQVHKIACNHYLTKDMKLTPMRNSDNAVAWFAMDYAEEDAAEEQFAAKFKNAELRKAFSEKFESLQQQLGAASPPKQTGEPAELQSPTAALDSVPICAPSVKPPSSGSGVLSPPSFSFSSSTITPKSDTNTITSTPTPAPKSVFGSLSQSGTPTGPFVFGGFGNQSSAAVYGTPDPAPTKTTPKSDNIFKAPSQNGQPAELNDATKPLGFQPPVSNDAPSLMFGGNKLSEVSEKKSETSSSSFSFKVPDGSGFFSDGKAADFTWGNDSNQAKWMKSGPAPIFGQKPAATTNGKNNDENDGDDDGDDGEEEYDPQYAPIIEMPNLVEVTTGEEEEEVVYSQRAKLFRYDKPSKQWKERGVGDLKILKHRSKLRFRIVLRREQVHKIACNHYLTKDMKLTPMSNSDNAVVWFAMDYAEEDAAEEQFAAKFKNAELRKAFSEKFVSLQQQL